MDDNGYVPYTGSNNENERINFEPVPESQIDIKLTEVDIEDLDIDNWYYLTDENDNYIFGQINDMIQEGPELRQIYFKVYKIYDNYENIWRDLEEPPIYNYSMIDNTRPILYIYGEDVNVEAEAQPLPPSPEAAPEAVPEAVAQPKPPISPDTKFLGKGSFGFTLKPALPNKGEDGEWKQFNDTITKVFFDKKVRNNTLEKAAKIVSITGNERQILTKYTYNNYKKTNLPVGLQGLRMPEKLPLIRMPYLGVDLSIKNLNKPELLAKFRSLPIERILEQIQEKLIQVQKIMKAGFIHGDIRGPNIVANPDTGDITIIDFDLFNPIDVFFGKNVAFYNRPPENYFTYYFKYKFLKAEMNWLLQPPRLQKERFKTMIYKNDGAVGEYNLANYIYNNNEYSIWRKSLGYLIKDENIIDVLRQYLEKFMQGKYVFTEELAPEFQAAILPYFDGFGLASALLDFLVAVYTEKVFNDIPAAAAKDHLGSILHKGGAAGGAGAVAIGLYSAVELDKIYMALRDTAIKVLIPMSSLSVEGRIDINQAVEEMEKIVAEFSGAGAAAAGAAGAPKSNLPVEEKLNGPPGTGGRRRARKTKRKALIKRLTKKSRSDSGGKTKSR